MFDLIEKLRKKPDHIKKQIAFLIAFFLAGIIFVVWLSIIYPKFRQNQLKEEVVSKLEPSPIGTFGETFRTGISAIGEQFGKLKESISGISSSFIYSDTATSSGVVSATTTSTPQPQISETGTTTTILEFIRQF